jgi:DNA end-binding protein Ku
VVAGAPAIAGSGAFRAGLGEFGYVDGQNVDYFDDIRDEKVPSDMLEPAGPIVGTKTGEFEPERFEDQYEDAVREQLKKKQTAAHGKKNKPANQVFGTRGRGKSAPYKRRKKRRPLSSS